MECFIFSSKEKGGYEKSKRGKDAKRREFKAGCENGGSTEEREKWRMKDV
jgi:hypothetical protein